MPTPSVVKTAIKSATSAARGSRSPARDRSPEARHRLLPIFGGSSPTASSSAPGSSPGLGAPSPTRTGRFSSWLPRLGSTGAASRPRGSMQDFTEHSFSGGVPYPHQHRVHYGQDEHLYYYDHHQQREWGAGSSWRASTSYSDSYGSHHKPEYGVKPGTGSLAFRRHREAEGRAWLLHPFELRMQRWSLLVGCLLLAESFLLPLQSAFAPDASFGEAPLTATWRFLADCVFWLDIAIQFFVQAETSESSPKEFREVVGSYLRGAFLVDVASVAPISTIVGMHHFSIPALGDEIHSEACYPDLMAYHKLLRFTRWRRVGFSLQSAGGIFALPNQLTHSQRTLVTSLIAVLFCIHVMGCLWSTMAVCAAQEVCWFKVYTDSKPDAEGLYAHGGGLSIYMCAVYWSIYTLCGIGYGDIFPVSPLEYIVASICMFISSLTWAWVIANIVSIIAMMGEAQTMHLKTLDCVNEIMSSVKGKENRLAQRLREYFTKLQNVRDDGFVRTLTDRLSPELKMEVVYALHGNWLHKVWWIKMVPPESEFKVDLVRHLESNLHVPNEMIPSKVQLSVVREGLCMHGGRLLSKDAVFGEDMLLVSGALRRQWTTLALTYLHLMVLSKRTFEAVLEEHPDAQPYIRKAYRIFVLMRGTLKQAEIIKRQQRQSMMAAELEATEWSRFATPQEDANATRSIEMQPRASAITPGWFLKTTEEPDMPPSPSRRASTSGVAGSQASRGGFEDEDTVIGRLKKAEVNLKGRMMNLESLTQRLLDEAKALSSSMR